MILYKIKNNTNDVLFYLQVYLENLTSKNDIKPKDKWCIGFRATPCLENIIKASKEIDSPVEFFKDCDRITSKIGVEFMLNQRKLYDLIEATRILNTLEKTSYSEYKPFIKLKTRLDEFCKKYNLVFINLSTN